MDLGAVGGIVDDDYEDGKAQIYGGVDLAEAHQQPAVPHNDNCQPVRTREGGAHSHPHVKPDGLECFGEDEAGGVRYREVHRCEPGEVPAVDGDRALLRQHLLEDHERDARI